MRFRINCSLAAILFLVDVAAANATTYSFTNFDVPGGNTEINGINDRGQVVGRQYLTGTGVVYNVASQAFTFYPNVSATAINNNGQLVSGAILTSPFFIYDTATGSKTSIPTTINGFATFEATGINDAGEVVGATSNSGRQPSYYGFLRDPATGSYTQLVDPAAMPTPSREVTVPQDINNVGQIVGTITLSSSVYPVGFLFDRATGTYTTLSKPNAFETVVLGLNDVGQAVGTDGTNGFVLDLATGLYTDLVDPAGVSTQASGINNAGIVVGNYTDSAGRSHGFIATPQVGSTSVPEPASAALLGMGVLALALRVASRRV